MKRSGKINQALRFICTASLIISLTGCSSEQISDASRTADQTVFNHDSTATNNWDPDRAPQLNLPEVQAYVQRIAMRIGKSAQNPGAYEIRVTDDPQVNGASEMGGTIVITRGMLNVCANEAELAAYIGHEIGHQDLHQTSSTSTPSKGLLSRIVDRGLQYVPDSTGAISEAQKQANDIRQARFSQQKEQDADEYGATLASKAGYDPCALADLFDRLAKQITNNPFYRLAKLKGSHKALDTRAAHLREFLKNHGFSRQGELAQERYQRALASLLVFEKVPVVDSTTAKQLRDIRQELTRYSKDGKRLPAAEFIAVMQRLSRLEQSAGSGSPKCNDVFMNTSLIQAGNQYLARAGTGAFPEVIREEVDLGRPRDRHGNVGIIGRARDMSRCWIGLVQTNLDHRLLGDVARATSPGGGRTSLAVARATSCLVLEQSFQQFGRMLDRPPGKPL